MAKTSAFKATLTGLLTVGLLRAVLKILWIDPATGFYPVNSALGWIFGLALAAPIPFIAWALWQQKPESAAAQGGMLRELSSLVLGAELFINALLLLLPLPRLIAGYSGLVQRGASGLGMTVLLDVVIPLVSALLGFGAGVSFVLYGLRYASGAQPSFSPFWAALPPVWQCADALGRFFAFGQPLTCSDQLLETLFLVASCVLMLYHGDAAIGGTLADGALWVRMGAYLTLYFGGVLLFGQLGGWIALGSQQTSGPALAQGLHILILCAYTFIYLRSLSEK